jgi:GrpB-like predicted nucleotidyltransferase (UPF0157 family)
MTSLEPAAWPAHPPIEINLVPYNPEWPNDFQREKQRLVIAFNRDPQCQSLAVKEENYRIVPEKIVHIGSTSIPGATAKPCIDILYDLSTDLGPSVAHFWISFFERHGYSAYGRKLRHDDDRNIAGRYWYKPCDGPSSSCRGYFLHLAQYNPLEKFAERLRSEPSLVQQYNEAKRRILADHPRIGFAEYTMLKTAFITRLLSDIAKDDYEFSSDFTNPSGDLGEARWYNGSRTSRPLYELIHFITSAAAGHLPLTQPLSFPPNEAFDLEESVEYGLGYSQIFTPLGLALVLAVEPRLSALWDRYDPGYHNVYRNIGSCGVWGTSTSQRPLDVHPSQAERQQRLVQFGPIIRRLRQHGCTIASFVSWTTEGSSSLDVASIGGFNFGGIAPVNRADIFDGVKDGYERRKKMILVLESTPGAAVIVPKVRESEVGRDYGFFQSCICLPELRNFGSSAAALCGIACIMSALDSLQQQHCLAAFIRENVTDDVACALSTDELRALGLGMGDAKRFIAAVQQQMAASKGQIAAATVSGGSGVAAVTSTMSKLTTSTASAHNDLQPLLATEYRGVIAIVSGYTPSHSCPHCMIHQLVVVLPEVVRMEFIVQECTRKLESLQHGLATAAVKLPPDMAFSIVAYTYDLGISSTTDDGRCAPEKQHPLCALESAISRNPLFSFSDNLFVALNKMLQKRDPVKVPQPLYTPSFRFILILHAPA